MQVRGLNSLAVYFDVRALDIWVQNVIIRNGI